MSESSQASLIVIVLDLSSRWKSLLLSESIDHVIVFANAHLSLNAENQVAVIATTNDAVEYVYPRASSVPSSLSRANMPEQCNRLQAQTKAGVTALAEAGLSDANTHLAPALSKGLCYCNKHLKPRQQKQMTERDESRTYVDQARVLVLSTSSEASDEYVPVMNVAFAAKKINVLIDVCSIGTTNSLLQQTADLTQGRHLTLDDTSNLLQHLLCTFASDAVTRGVMKHEEAVAVNYQATCFCHGRSVSQGLVCSVCLSIFCEPKVVCPSCRTLFARAKKKKKAKRNASKRNSNTSSKRASRSTTPTMVTS
eukprot:TRINITY_DN11065_c0_g1_i2.p1 TRINITY_DN11065_c0_g1~~TRINITY_DN11065_c0_g1_i2.p1  ORF type:complete len:310 (+),score=44.03 TRINITY_DN11065_c0_g1_i2:98-1027(+)